MAGPASRPATRRLGGRLDEKSLDGWSSTWGDGGVPRARSRPQRQQRAKDPARAARSLRAFRARPVATLVVATTSWSWQRALAPMTAPRSVRRRMATRVPRYVERGVRTGRRMPGTGRLLIRRTPDGTEMSTAPGTPTAAASSAESASSAAAMSAPTVSPSARPRTSSVD